METHVIPTSARSVPRALAALLAALLTAAPVAPAAAAPQRIKELADVQGVRDNELFGYGLVVGLGGTGDSEQVLFTSQAVSGMLGRLGIRIDPREVRVRNVAAVMVTARLPGFSRPGSKLDVTVSSMGNARSLEGGVLLVTPLRGADGEVYAVSQGPVQVGGFTAGRNGTTVRKNTVNAGRIPQGATVERAVAPDLSAGPLVLSLRRPDFTTATRIAAGINAALNAKVAKAVDPAAVELTPATPTADRMELLAQVEAIEVEADGRARVVVSERTGTVVVGERVRLRPAAVAHGGLSVAISDTPVVSQPAPYSGGRTRETSMTDVEAKEFGRGIVALPQTATVDELVKALNTLGAAPRDLVAILQALQAAGALDAELEVI